MMNETPDSDQYWQALEAATLHQAADLAKRLNARNWGAALANSSLTEHVTAHAVVE